MVTYYEAVIQTRIAPGPLWRYQTHRFAMDVLKDATRPSSDCGRLLYRALLGGSTTIICIRSTAPFSGLTGVKHSIELQPGQRVSLAALVAPVKRNERNNESFLTTPEQVIEWAKKQLLERGYEATSIEIVSENIDRLDKPQNGSGIRAHAVDLQITATVRDPALAERALITGIGRKKGFGFGMPVLMDAEGGQA